MGIVTSVQNVSITISAGQTTGTATVTSVDMTLSALRIMGVRGAHTGYNPATDTASVVKTNSTTITATRNTSDASNSLIVNCSLTTFSSAAIQSVQDGIVTITNTTNTATITSVTLNNAALYFGGSITTNTNTLYFSPDLVLTDATTVTANVEAGAFTTKAYFTVVEFKTGILNSAVQRGTISFASGDTTKTATITGVTTSQTMLLNNGALLGSTTGNSDFWPRVTLTNGTTVTAARTTSGTTETVSFEVVEFKAADVVSVNRGTITIASSGTSNTATIASVNTAYCSVEWQGNTSGASVAETVAKSCATITLTDATTLTAERSGSPAISLIVNYEAIEFKSATATNGNMFLVF